MCLNQKLVLAIHATNVIAEKANETFYGKIMYTGIDHNIIFYNKESSGLYGEEFIYNNMILFYTAENLIAISMLIIHRVPNNIMLCPKPDFR